MAYENRKCMGNEQHKEFKLSFTSLYVMHHKACSGSDRIRFDQDSGFAWETLRKIWEITQLVDQKGDSQDEREMKQTQCSIPELQ